MAFWIDAYETNAFLVPQGTITCFTYDTKLNVFKACLTKDEREEELAIYEEEEGYTCKPIDPYYK